MLKSLFTAISYLSFGIGSAAFILFVYPQVADARSLEYEKYIVDIDVHADSTVDVTERFLVRFYGEYQGVIRGVTLSDQKKERFCASSGLTCGGFEYIALTGVYDEDRKLTPDEYELYIETDDDDEASYYVVKRYLWPAGTYHSGEELVNWAMSYRLYGSIGWVGRDPSTADPYLYWNAIPSDRGGSIDTAEINITFPAGTSVNMDDLEVYYYYGGEYEYEYQDNELHIALYDLTSLGDVTVEYKIPKDVIQRPSSLTAQATLPLGNLKWTVDGVELGEISDKFQNFPAGKHTIKFSYLGYESKEVSVNVLPNENIEVDATLNPTQITWGLIILSICLNILGVVLIPIVFLWLYLRWRRSGKDKDMPKTIIPLFTPPENVQPYMIGSLKDEKVDREDVTGTIIDLAYRGYIKIKEVEHSKNYTLIFTNKPKDKDPGLNLIEKQLLDDIFGGKTEVETKNLGETFATKYQGLVKKIYSEMVSRGYFNQQPNNVRYKYIGYGILVFFAGVTMLILSSFLWLIFAGFIAPIILFIAVIILGIGLFSIASHMPAKTPIGSKVFAEILGFRMYLHTAERYRLQKLEPEYFEKYLSYAIVFKIEKEWAEKFKDIYKGKPDWYDGTADVWDAYWISRFTRDFATSMSSTAYVHLSSGSGAGSGSGWSGGGGGGFSGGGGGGGFGGGF